MSKYEKRAREGENRWWLAGIAGAAGCLHFLLLFYPLLLGNLYQGSDIGSQQFPYRAFYSYCLERGYSFLWWPQEFCGYYLHAEGQGAFFHPVQWLLYRFLPLATAFNVEFMAAYLFLYGGMVALLRHWRLPWYGALFGANLFTFSGFTLYHFTHIQAITVVSHLPWVLLVVDVLLKSPAPKQLRRTWLGLVVLVASQLLSGYPQYVLFTLMAVGLYVLFHLRQSGLWRSIALITSGLLLGLMIAGVQILPTFDLIQYAQRQDAAEFWKQGSLHPLNLLQWAGPYWYSGGGVFGEPYWEFALYAGALPTVLALCWLGRWRAWRDAQAPVRFALLLVPIMVVLALGEFGGVYQFIAKLPVLGAFRCPARHIVLVHLAVAMLGAFFLARLGEQPEKVPARALLIGIAVAGWLSLVLVLILGAREGVEGDPFTASWPWLLVGPLLITCAVALVYGAHRWPTMGIAAVILFSALDSAVYTMPFVWNHKPQSTGHEALKEVLALELPDDPLFEPYTGEYRAHGNWRIARLSQLGLAGYMGYVGLPPAWSLDPDAPVTKRVAGVRWEKVPFSSPTWTVHEDALPLARLVTGAVQSDTPREAIKTIDVATTAIVADAVALSGGAPGTLAWITNEPGKAVWKTAAETEQLLVFAQRHHPGWRVEVDGETRPLLRVNGDFMGCAVPVGEHTVSFTFRPASFRSGLGVSGLGLVLTFGLWGWLVRGGRSMSRRAA